MIKYLFTILALTFLLNADHLSLSNNHCVVDLVPYQNNSGLCWHDQHDSLDYCDNSLKLSDFIDGYSYVDGSCLYKNDLILTGLTQSEWNYILALLANVIGFTMLFFISFLTVLIARK